MNTLIWFLGLLAVALGGRIHTRYLDQRRYYITGGHCTGIMDVPHQVSLQEAIGGSTSHFCGGSIVSTTHIVTAAHCVMDYINHINFLRIRAGSSYSFIGGVFLSVYKIVTHPKFNPHTLDYDVAVIELPTPLKFGFDIKPINLTDTPPPDGEFVKVSGWGYLKEDGPMSLCLQSVMVPMVNWKVCRRNYRSHMQITPRMICAGRKGKDACQGDSGGPLVDGNRLVGIVSSGRGCGKKRYPGIYTSVADPEVRAFIKQQIHV